MLRPASDRRPGLLHDFSLEMTAKDLSAVEVARELIPPRSSISITSLSRETIDSRVRAAVGVARLGFLPVPHISARQVSSGADLRTMLDRFEVEAGIERAFIIAGDVTEPAGPYFDSLEIIASGALEGRSLSCVGIAGYPEGHPKIDQATLWSALKSKHRELTKRGHEIEIVTQFGFDAEPIVTWLERLRFEGIDSAVRIGVAGPASAATLVRFAGRCGVGASAKILAKYGLSATRLLGTTGPDKLVRSLERRLDRTKHGEVKLHFYPFGGFARTTAWVQEFVGAAPGYLTPIQQFDVTAGSLGHG